MEVNLGRTGRGGLIVFATGLSLFLLGFSVKSWVSLDESDYQAGLWKYCRKEVCRKVSDPTFKFFGKSLPAWWRGTQAVACLAVITVAVDVILRGLFIFFERPRTYLLLSIGLDIFTAFLVFCAAALFGAYVEEEAFMDTSLGWGFAVFIVGGIFIFFAAPCFILEYRNHFY